MVNLSIISSALLYLLFKKWNFIFYGKTLKKKKIE